MLKGILTYISLCIISLSVFAQKATITESAGWLESAFVKWQTVDGAESYNVYYSGQGKTDEKIDDQLIRKYEGYYRADVLGLEAGTYTLKVVPVVNGEESEASITQTLNVEAHDRTGFAFSNNRMPGAYNQNGTPRAGAVVLYITENSKNSIELEVTGANSNLCVGLQAILEGFKKGKDNRPLIVRLVGQITDLEVMDKGDIVIENDNNSSGFITFEGVGDDAVADGWGIRVKNASNIEIRNIGLMNTNSEEGDDIGLQQNNDHIWVHHCDFFYGDAGGDSDQAKGDGALDCKKSTFVTFSYNHFWDTGKSNLLGLSEGTTEGLFITYHHNWYDHSDSRHPRVRYYSAHVYNNYYDGNAKYGVGATLGSSVFVEANYFRNCKYPILTSMQGSDVFDESSQSNDYSDMPTFSKEDGGSIKAFNNYMTGQKRFVAYGDPNYPNSTVDFDAYVASERDEIISDDVKSAFGSNTYNNFDTNSSVMYDYTADSPEDAKTKVMAYAGRMNGGDFKWTFNNAVDDALYSLNSELKTSLVNYTTGLIEVQADSADTGGGNGGTGGGDSEISEDIVHNFTESGTTSTYFNISGNLSDSKGTVVFNDLTLTKCLKIESITSIKFTTTVEASLTLVFNPTFAGRIKVDGTSYTASAGIVTITIAAGEHEITKTDVANLYYININFVETGTPKMNTSSDIKVYPNPVTRQLNILSANEIEHLAIYNMSGARLVLDLSGTKTIDLSELITGSYILEVVANGQCCKKLILKK